MNRFIFPALFASIAIATGIVFAASQNDSAAQQTTARYSVSGAGDSAVLVDSTKGQTWLLHRSVAPGEPDAWIQITRFDDNESAQKWRSTQEGLQRDSDNRQYKLLQVVNEELNMVYKKLHVFLKEGVDPESPDMRSLQRRASSLEWRVTRLEQSQDSD